MRFQVIPNDVATVEEARLDPEIQEQMRKADPDFDKSDAEKAADKITTAAGIKDSAGEKLAEIIDIPMVVPRGKYTFQVFGDYFKLHGKTHDYKLAFKDVNRAFLLHKNDNIHTSYVLALNSPVRSGQTQHYFLVPNRL